LAQEQAKAAGGATAGLADQASFRIFEGKAMKRQPAKRNPIAGALAKPQYRPRIKPDKRRKIEAKRRKRQLSAAAKP
jgi:hypothetical protein